MDSQKQSCIATVRVNIFLLALGPVDCRIALMNDTNFCGNLQFKCLFQQRQEVSISLNDFKISIQGLVPCKIKTGFKIKVPTFGVGDFEVNTFQSQDSSSVGGKFVRSHKTQTKFLSTNLDTPSGGFGYPSSSCDVLPGSRL